MDDGVERDLRPQCEGKGLLFPATPANNGKIDNMNFLHGAGNFVFEVNQYPL